MGFTHRACTCDSCWFNSLCMSTQLTPTPKYPPIMMTSSWSLRLSTYSGLIFNQPLPTTQQRGGGVREREAKHNAKILVLQKHNFPLFILFLLILFFFQTSGAMFFLCHLVCEFFFLRICFCRPMTAHNTDMRNLNKPSSRFHLQCIVFDCSTSNPTPPWTCPQLS